VTSRAQSDRNGEPRSRIARSVLAGIGLYLFILAAQTWVLLACRHCEALEHPSRSPAEGQHAQFLETADDENDLPPPQDSAQGWTATVPIDLVIVRERDGWLVPIVTPMLAKLKTADGGPLLLAASGRRLLDTPLVKRLAPRHCLVLGSARTEALWQSVDGLPAEVVKVEQDPMTAGLALAKQFWGATSEVVTAPHSDPGAVILGSQLAALLAVPFIPTRQHDEEPALLEAVQELKVTRVLAASTGPLRVGLDRPAPLASVHPLRTLDIHRRVVERIGRSRVRNIVLARVPDETSGAGGTAWLAPYYGLFRASPVVLCDEADGSAAQDAVRKFVHAHGLTPRSVTILADYGAIGLIAMAHPQKLGEYEVEVEPCAEPSEGRANATAVGRIPCTTLRGAALLLSAGFARERLLRGEGGRVLMLANPQTEYGTLPLAESIARAAAAEFRNFGLDVQEFYGTPADASHVLAVANQAHLVIFQGHLTDQVMFLPPEEAEAVPYDEEEAYDGTEQDPAGLIEVPNGDEAADEVVAPGEPGEEPEPADAPQDDEPAAEQDAADGQYYQAQVPAPVRRDPLEGMPLVMLQSCHSLGEAVAAHIYDRGAVGLVASTTSIHSASGSAFAKAFCDGLLYRNDTLGEALRDARNYVFCLLQLKARRGHQQMAKGYRVALSFRLWGDPELRVLPGPLPKPRRRPVTARFTGPETVRIAVPARKLTRIETPNYIVRVPPGAQVAGVVRRLKHKTARRLMPFYFFRLPLPQGFSPRGDMDLARDGDNTPRTVFLPGPFGRFGYVLYFPKKDAPRERYVLRFR
jgi:hypothetical protein